MTLCAIRTTLICQAAIPKADRPVQIRTQYQGSDWWQTIDARQDLADLNRIAGLNASQRTALAAAGTGCGF